jgi:hypothetical protein
MWTQDQGAPQSPASRAHQLLATAHHISPPAWLCKEDSQSHPEQGRRGAEPWDARSPRGPLRREPSPGSRTPPRGAGHRTPDTVRPGTAVGRGGPGRAREEAELPPPSSAAPTVWVARCYRIALPFYIYTAPSLCGCVSRCRP